MIPKQNTTITKDIEQGSFNSYLDAAEEKLFDVVDIVLVNAICNHYDFEPSAESPYENERLAECVSILRNELLHRVLDSESQ